MKIQNQARRLAANAMFHAAIALEDREIREELLAMRGEVIARAARRFNRDTATECCELHGNAAYLDGELIHISA